MTLKQEVREVLRHLVFDYTMEEINTETPFDQATTQILTKFKEGLPKEQEGKDFCHKVPSPFCGSCHKIKGYNQAIDDCLKALSEKVVFIKDFPSGCQPYCGVLKECLAILSIFPFSSVEAQHCATKIKESISAIQEKRFEIMYYKAREEMAGLVKLLEVERKQSQAIDRINK